MKSVGGKVCLVHDDNDDKRSQKWKGKKKRGGIQILDFRRSPLHQQLQRGQEPRILPNGREEKGQGISKKKGKGG
jgi:hypothetical protein